MEQKVSVQDPEKRIPNSPQSPSENRPWGPLNTLRGEVDRLFDTFMSSWPFGGRDASSTFTHLPEAFRTSAPASDVKENGNAYVITVDLPGVDEKNIEVQVSDDVLTVLAEVTEERKEEKENYFLSERQHGHLQRAFRIPAGVNTDQIEARSEKGVLTITLPKTPEAQQKQRRIKVEAR